MKKRGWRLVGVFWLVFGGCVFFGVLARQWGAEVKNE